LTDAATSKARAIIASRTKIAFAAKAGRMKWAVAESPAATSMRMGKAEGTNVLGRKIGVTRRDAAIAIAAGRMAAERSRMAAGRSLRARSRKKAPSAAKSSRIQAADPGRARPSASSRGRRRVEKVSQLAALHPRRCSIRMSRPGSQRIAAPRWTEAKPSRFRRSDPATASARNRPAASEAAKRTPRLCSHKVASIPAR
jgi:hypothetical protein